MKNEILYNSGMKSRSQYLKEEYSEDYIRKEEIKNKISDSFNKLMREISYANNDTAYSYRYGNHGETPQTDEEAIKSRREMRKAIYSLAIEKLTKLKEIIEENLGDRQQNKETTTDREGTETKTEN